VGLVTSGDSVSYHTKDRATLVAPHPVGARYSPKREWTRAVHSPSSQKNARPHEEIGRLIDNFELLGARDEARLACAFLDLGVLDPAHG
jgi:hypothetical protein